MQTIQGQRERKVADRLRVVPYKVDGQTNQAIAALLQMSRYVDGGMSGLLAAAHYQGSVPKLTESQQ